MNLLLSVLVGFMGLTAEGDTIKRPIDPWVFYAGYDEAPGRLFVALHKNMWLVYDTTHANLYRTFKGSAFVNNSTQNGIGPEAVVQGFDMLVGEGGKAVWKVNRNGLTQDVQVRFAGYEMRDKRLHLIYKLTTKDGTVITVEESPEYEDLLQKKLDRYYKQMEKLGEKELKEAEKAEKEAAKSQEASAEAVDGDKNGKKAKKEKAAKTKKAKVPTKPSEALMNRVAVERIFMVKDLPADTEVYLHLEVEDLYKAGDIKTDGKLTNEYKSKQIFDWGNLVDYEGDLILQRDKPTVLSITFTIDPERASQSTSN
ncbi:MAG: hypothetical protein AAFR61_11045 [Bacteroidota bacterium]